MGDLVVSDQESPKNEAGRRGARPATQLTPEVHKRIVAMLRAGNYLETAASAAGITSKTLRIWLRWGKMGREPFRQFATDVDVAVGESQALMVQQVRSWGQRDWRANGWLLERRFPDLFGARLQVTSRVRDELSFILDALRAELDRETFQRVATIVVKAFDRASDEQA